MNTAHKIGNAHVPNKISFMINAKSFAMLNCMDNTTLRSSDIKTLIK